MAIWRRYPAIEAHGLTQRFGSFTAVDHVSFRIERGEIFGLSGSNGCGKTTTMKMLTGLLPPTEGTALLFGQQVKGGDVESRRRVGFMSQAFSLYTELTVRQNLLLHAHLFDLAKEASHKRVDELLNSFRARSSSRNSCRKSAPWYTTAALSGGRGNPRTRDAHPRRTNLWR